MIWFISILAVVFYILIFCLIIDEGEEFYLAWLWPLVFIKYLLKGLYKILFTDWKVD